MQNILTLNETTSNNNGYILASVAVLTFIFCGIQYLAYGLDTNVVDMSYLLYEAASTELKDYLYSTIQSSLCFNNLTNRYSLVMPAESWENLKMNAEKIHLYILHSSVIHLVLFTINPDLTINVYAEATINPGTSATDLALMRTQFNISLSALAATRGPIEINITLLINNVHDLFITPQVFLPITDYMRMYPCGFFYNILGYPELAKYISNISNNLPTLMQEIQLYANRCSDTFATTINQAAIEDDDDAELLWVVMKGEHQLMRYLEGVYSVYGPIQPISTDASYAMEDI